jgi:hypothetical protein
MAPTFKGDLDGLLRADPGLASMNDPNDARKSIDEAKSKLRGIRCCETSPPGYPLTSDDPGGPALEGRVNGWASALESAIAEELKCRTSVECMAGRVASQICATMADRQEAQRQIAAEKKNAGGGVNLVTLHDLGERIQIDSDNIGNLKTQYASMVHRPFNGLCPK